MSTTTQHPTSPAFPPVPFSYAEGEAAHSAWGFNCGPAALCAALQVTPADLRPHLFDFERKGYTNPSLMFQALKRLVGYYDLVYRADAPGGLQSDALWPEWGLARVQWSGPWTRPGVPMKARYRKSHWVALARQDGRRLVFDINATSDPAGRGWLTPQIWESQLVPWIFEGCEGLSQADGWWFTHVIRLRPNLRNGLFANPTPP